MSPQPPPDSAVKLYDALVATHPDVERKGKSSPYTSVNGNMFTILSADGTLGMRLADADRDAFIATYRTGLYHAHGTVLKQYVAVPADLLARTAELVPYLAKSYDYAKSLKPKPTSRQQ
jgi:TfoX/Sxy family transcriptional regulator of competence genes